MIETYFGQKKVTKIFIFNSFLSTRLLISSKNLIMAATWTFLLNGYDSTMVRFRSNDHLRQKLSYDPWKKRKLKSWGEKLIRIPRLDHTMEQNKLYIQHELKDNF